MQMWWLVIIVLAFLVPEVLSTIFESRIGRAVAARIEGRGQAASADGLNERVRYLEGELDRLSQEVNRLTEETEFFQRLLTERSQAADSERAPRDRPP